VGVHADIVPQERRGELRPYEVGVADAHESRTAVLHERVLLAARLHLGSRFGPSVREASGAVDDCFDRRHG
jgi:hypothetical protein